MRVDITFDDGNDHEFTVALECDFVGRSSLVGIAATTLHQMVEQTGYSAPPLKSEQPKLAQEGIY